MSTSNNDCRNSIHRSAMLLAFPFIAVVFVCVGLLPTAQAVTPAPDGGYPGSNTAEGDFALLSLTTGVYNTAVGTEALLSNTTGGQNTGVGAFALEANTTGTQNTGLG